MGGETSRFNLIGTLSGENTTYQAFLTSYSLNLFGNPTYFLNDPINGDQIEQEDARWIFGGRVDNSRDLEWSNHEVVFRTGADLRFDAISDINLFLTSDRDRLSAIRTDSVDELRIGAYADVEVSRSDKLRTSVGLRADQYSWDVTSLRAANSGSGSDAILSPNFSLAYALND